MNRQQRNQVIASSNTILNVMFRLKQETGRLYGMDNLYEAVQPFTMGDVHKPKTRLKRASSSVSIIVDQVRLRHFGTFALILCDNLRAYLHDLSQAIKE